MWLVEFTPRSRRQLSSLPLSVQERIRLKLRGLSEKPFDHMDHFSGPYYKLRVGDYRLLLRANFEQKILIAEVIAHRSIVYKR
jgi:mRNA interferase RelE/StbE